MMPKRIQRKRDKGWRSPPNTVYVGRPSRWGRPHNVALSEYRQYVAAVGLPVAQLRGKDLSCWCPPGKPCHADILLELANATQSGSAGLP